MPSFRWTIAESVAAIETARNLVADLPDANPEPQDSDSESRSARPSRGISRERRTPTEIYFALASNLQELVEDQRRRDLLEQGRRLELKRRREEEERNKAKKAEETQKAESAEKDKQGAAPLKSTGVALPPVVMIRDGSEIGANVSALLSLFCEERGKKFRDASVSDPAFDKAFAEISPDFMTVVKFFREHAEFFKEITETVRLSSTPLRFLFQKWLQAKYKEGAGRRAVAADTVVADRYDVSNAEPSTDEMNTKPDGGSAASAKKNRDKDKTELKSETVLRELDRVDRGRRRSGKLEKSLFEIFDPDLIEARATSVQREVASNRNYKGSPLAHYVRFLKDKLGIHRRRATSAGPAFPFPVADENGVYSVKLSEFDPRWAPELNGIKPGGLVYEPGGPSERSNSVRLLGSNQFKEVWQRLIVKLYSSHGSVLREKIGAHFESDFRRVLLFSSDPRGLRIPFEVADGFYVETAFSAAEFCLRMREVLALCKLDLDRAVVSFTQSERKTSESGVYKLSETPNLTRTRPEWFQINGWRYNGVDGWRGAYADFVKALYETSYVPEPQAPPKPQENNKKKTAEEIKREKEEAEKWAKKKKQWEKKREQWKKKQKERKELFKGLVDKNLTSTRTRGKSRPDLVDKSGGEHFSGQRELDDGLYLITGFSAVFTWEKMRAFAKECNLDPDKIEIEVKARGADETDADSDERQDDES